MKIRTRLLAVFALFILSVVVGFMYLIAEEIRPNFLKAQEETLVDFSETLAGLISQNAVSLDKQGVPFIDTSLLKTTFQALPHRELSAQIYELDKSQVDTRIYIVDAKGIVIFDSDNDRDVGQDYSKWRDVRRTFNGEYGARTSWADPIYPEGDTMYIARPINWGDRIVGVLSVGKPTKNADTFIDNLNLKLWVSGIAFGIFATLIGIMINLWITRPLDSIQRYATGISRGERPVLPDAGNNEVGDVSRALESMRKALDGKSYIEEYVHSLTHEIKAPLAGIRGAAELLNEPLPKVQQSRFLSNVVTQTERIQHIVERLLDLSELENAERLKTKEKVPLDAVFNQVTESQHDYAESFDLSLDSISNQLALNGDAFLIEQAVTNLVKNAIEHADKGSKITMMAEQRDGGVTISVINQGKDIPDYALPHLFDRFYSLPNREGNKGSGIGLSFVKEIAQLHGGQVDVLSINGLTTFKMTI